MSSIADRPSSRVKLPLVVGDDVAHQPQARHDQLPAASQGAGIQRRSAINASP
jgi:hypothetical protein